MKRVEQIEGSLSTEAGDKFPILLTLTIVELHGTAGVESEEPASVRLASQVADGVYTLDYFYMKPIHRPVRVKYGAFVSA
jgi:hypothetical protein